MSDKQEKQDEKGKFAEFVSSAIRAPRQGVYEHLLSQFLASAVVVSDPLKRIRIVAEAAMMVPEQERQDLAIDYETVDSLNQVRIALQNRMIQRDYWIKHSPPFELVSISWGFPRTKENYEKYIAPWDHTVIYYSPPVVIMMHRHADAEAFKRQPWWKRFFDVSVCLPLNSYLTLKNQYVAYAIPKVQLMLAELTRLVQPSLYANILGLYTKKRSYSEKVAEVAKGTTQTEESPDRR